MEDDEHTAPPIRIPYRIFTVGEEPVGVRITLYHKPYAIRQILNAEEVDTIRASPFGKLVEIATSHNETQSLGLNGGQGIQSDVHTEGQTPRDSPEKSGN
ncbi:unnamed protein product [Brassica rapa]|uniref:Uncharacterized protein n=1 Tax=Brassica campestris TaxID=3711 RepID=A0A3P6B2Z5_BRACM|nr:unnamed protein product [Brassica rapa]VDC97617.1 unnamed protein product [Brassica rapa]